ncbi:MAG: PKD domain-containing protein [Flavobacteriales bacterium]|nr:PKD domain-containing protein [Flavobacteriales bacterium]
MRRFTQKAILTIGLVVLSMAQGFAQCPELYDFYGAPSANPYWYHCTGSDYTLNIQSPDNIGTWTIDWGDGSPTESGPDLIPPASISHLYTATVDTFVVTFTETSSGCVVQGVLVMEEATSASIQIPIGGLTQACAPQDMEFTNSSTNVSETTIFTWDFGDGSPQEVYDYTNWNQTITHTYQENTVDCETMVTLTAENYCNTVQGGNSTATFDPIRIWDYDDAGITPSDYVLCWPDNTVDYLNTTQMNCYFQGNIAQRYEYWNFGDYWGLGYDSIIPWTPWPPTFPHTISYPAIGSYSVMLLDSNFCGIDTAFVTIDIVPPPAAGVTISDDTICQGETVTFFNNSSPEANAWLINFDNGSGWQPMGPTSVSISYALPGDYQIGLVAYVSGAGASCTDTAWVDLHVQQSPVADFSLSDLEDCDTLQYAVTESSIDAVDWNWNMGNGNTYTIQDPPDQTYTSIGSHIVTLEVTGANGCMDNTSQVVDVYESPSADFFTTDLCLGDTATFTDISSYNPSDPIIDWAWDFGDTQSGTGNPIEHYYASGGTYDVLLTVNTANCADDTTITVNVDTPPTASFSADVTSGCSPLTVNFTNTSSSAYSYTWNFGDGATSNDTSTVHTFDNPSDTDTTYTVYLTASNAFGCGSVDSIDITVNGFTEADFISDATPGCAPFDVQFTNQSSGASSYQWDFGDGTPISNDVDPSHFFNNTTEFIQNYVVELIAFDINGCHDTTYQTVTSYPEPDFSFDVSGQSGCAPLTVDFPAISGAVSYDWSFGDGNTSNSATPSHTYINVTDSVLTFDIRLIASNAFGCTDTTYSQVDVYPSSQSVFTMDTDEGCSPVAVEFSNQSYLAAQSEWIFGTGDTLVTSDSLVNYVFTNGGTTANSFNVILNVTSAQGCTSSSQQTVDVFPLVTAGFNSETEGCSPLDISFLDTSVGATDYYWTFGDGGVSVSDSPNHVYVNNSTSTVTYTATQIVSNDYGCSDTASVDIDVYARPIAQFDSSPIAGCSPLTVEFENTSILADESLWIFGTGDSLLTNDTILEYIYTNPSLTAANYQIQLEITTNEGCTDVANDEITVYPEVHADYNSITEGCSPLEVQFNNLSVGADNYSWTFGDGSFGINEDPLHTYVNNGLETDTMWVELLATNTYGCQDTASSQILVYPRPIAQFNASPTLGCSPLELSIENTSVLADVSEWIFDPGDTLVTNNIDLEHTYVNSGSDVDVHTIQLNITSTHGCTSSATQEITVYPDVEAGFTSISEGCSPLEVQFTNESLGATSYAWYFGDGGFSVEESPLHNYVNNTSSTQIHTVELIATNSYGCQDPASIDITVYPRPIAQFTATPMVGCSPLEVMFNNDSFLADENMWIYDTGDTLITSDEIHDYTFVNTSGVTQNYDVTLEITSVEGCSSSYSRTITVYPEVQADFSMNSEGCSPLQVGFVNQSSGASSYTWDFGDGLMDVNSDPSHLYLNESLADTTFTVILTASSNNGCTDTHIDSVLVHPVPVAAFNLNTVEGCSPLTVTINDQSQIADTYQWTYGDGTLSDTTASMHEYTYISSSVNVVEYNLQLIVETEHGCQDMTETTVTVYPEVQALFDTEEALCSGDIFTFFNQSQGAMSYQWEFGDGSASVSNNPLHTYSNNSGAEVVYDVTLTATSQYQCVDQYTDSVVVYTAPIADISIDSSSVCYPLYIDFANNSQYATDYAWDYGDGSTSENGDSIHSHVFTNSTTNLITYEIEMIAYTENGCMDTAYSEVQVIPPLEADFESIEEGCHPLEVEFFNESSGALAYDWYFEEGAVDTVENPTYIFNNYGIEDEVFDVVLVASSYFGCSDTMTTQITVFPLPDAEFSVDPVIQTYPDATVDIFNNSVSGATAIYEWDLGDGTSSFDPDLSSHTYSTWGTYELSLTIDNGHCSDQMIQVIEIQAPPPVADFAGGGEGCAPITIAFENLSEYGTNYLWNFGDGGVSSNEEPVYTYYIPGTYTVSLLVTGPGGSEIAVRDTIVHVYPNSTAYFTANPDIVNTGDVVFFYNLSNQADEFFWEFGDGNTSTETDPTHIYQETGYFDVTLIANNEYNCPDTFRLEDAVFVDVGGYVDFPNAFTPNSLSSNGGYYDPTRLDNDVFYPVFAGVEDFQLQIYNRWGELLYESDDVNKGWDGYYKGRLAQQGVYVWRATVTFTDGKQVIKAGDLTLLR